MLIQRAAAFALAAAAAWLTSTGGQRPAAFTTLWSRWDARHFIQIAEFGYSGAGTDPHATEWWPALPLAIRALGTLGFSPVIAGLLITALATTIAFAFVYKLAESDVARGAGPRAVVLLAIFPTAVFLVAPYSESLFLAGATGAFWFARRGRWLAVGLFAALAMASRLPGAFVLVGLGVEFLRQRSFTARRFRDAIVGLGIGAVPFAAYSLFLWRARGDPFYYVTDADLGWNRHFVGPLDSFLTTWRTWGSESLDANWQLAFRIEIVTSALMVALVVWALIKREWGYAAFMGTLSALLLSTTWYLSHPRMLLMYFPAVLFLAGATEGRPRLHDALLAVGAPVAALGVVLYTSGAWFF